MTHTEYVRKMGELVMQLIELSEKRWVTREKELLAQIADLEKPLKGDEVSK